MGPEANSVCHKELKGERCQTGVRDHGTQESSVEKRLQRREAEVFWSLIWGGSSMKVLGI